MKLLKFFALILFSLLTFKAHSQNESSVIWKIEKDGNTSYIFGIIDYIPESFRGRLDVVNDLLLKVNQCVFEFAPATDTLRILHEMKILLNEEFEEYNVHFSKKQFRKLDKRAKAAGYLSLYSFDQFDPAFTVKYLTPLIKCEYKVIDIEKHILNSPVTFSGIKTFLEWQEFYKKNYEGGTDSIYKDFIDSKDKKSVLSQNKMKLDQVFLEESIDTADSICECEVPIDRTEYETIWLPKINEMVLSNSNLFVLPFFSLGKNDGILEILRRAGYTVTAL